MSEKRFQKHMDNTCLDVQEHHLYPYASECVDLLNEQVTECNQLREENKRLKSRNNYNLEDCLLEIGELKEENERLRTKLNTTALELVSECISMGKAVEISEMSYREFLDYRAKNGKPMELQL